MRFTQDETRALKGVAILMMLVHHAFGLPTLIEPPATYIGLIPGFALEEYLGRYSKVCVALFLMISGYGIAVQGGPWRAKTWRRVAAFYRTYWLWFVLLIGIGALFFADVPGHDGPRFALEPGRLVANALAIRHDYAFEWWFAEIYVVLLLLAPLICRAGRWPWLLLAGAVAAFFLGAALDVLRVRTPVFSPANLLIWQLPFVYGVLLAGWARFGRALPSGAVCAVIVALGFVAVEIAFPKGQTPWLIVSAPLSFKALMAALRGVRLVGNRALGFVADRALPIWLVHPFAVYYFAQPLVYAPLWSPLVLGWLLALTLAVVWAVESALRGLK